MNRKIIFTFLSFVAVFATAQETGEMQRASLDATGAKTHVLLETASWGQNSPFNNLCWTEYGGAVHAKTGCVPTAYAIVMRYHRWPEEGTGTLYNSQKPSLPFEEVVDRTYDYDKMPLVYDRNWTPEQQNEIAKLMSHLGHAFGVEYGSGGTSVSDPQSTAVPNKYFNYNLQSAAYQMDYTLKAWQEKIRQSLDNGCPVIYAANNAGTGDTRHMFVIDGYTDNGYFHFNFGWAGSGNGWFELDAIKPSQGDDYSWQEGSEHYAIFNFAPHKVLCEVRVAVSQESAGTVTVDGGAPCTRYVGEKYDCNNLKLVATPADGYEFSHWSKGDEIVSVETECVVRVVVGDSDYVANFVKVSETETVEFVFEYNNVYGKVKCGSIVCEGVKMFNKNSRVVLVATPVEGCSFDGWVINGQEYSAGEVKVLATEDMTVVAKFSLPVVDYVIDSTTGTTLTAEKVCRWEYAPTEKNPLAVTLSSNENAIAYNASNKVLRLYTGEGNVKYVIAVPEGYIIDKYQFTQARMSSAKNNIRVVAGKEYAVETTAQDIVVENVNAAVTEFSVTGEANKSLQIANIVVTVKKNILGDNTTAISDVRAENGKLKGVYDLSGRKLEGINGPGIYIVNGKKVLVK